MFFCVFDLQIIYLSLNIIQSIMYDQRWEIILRKGSLWRFIVNKYSFCLD